MFLLTDFEKELSGIDAGLGDLPKSDWIRLAIECSNGQRVIRELNPTHAKLVFAA